MIAGPFCYPAHAQAKAGWVADTSEDRCALQYYQPTDEVLFELALDVEDGSYSVNGMILLGYSRAQMQSLRITASLDDQTIVLMDSWEGLGRYLTEKQLGTPVPAFFRAMDSRNQQTLELDTGGNRQSLSLEGYDAARETLSECVNAFFYRTETSSQPRLIAFTGLRELAGVAGRQNLLAQNLEYTLTIDPTGKPTSCEYSRRFRRKATRIALCRPLLKTMTFEPARDASGQAVEGRYTGTIDFQMWMGKDGYLKNQ